MNETVGSVACWSDYESMRKEGIGTDTSLEDFRAPIQNLVSGVRVVVSRSLVIESH